MKSKNIIAAVAVAFLAVACAGTATETSTGEYIDDAAITAKVKTDLLQSDDTSGLAITVETFKGTVQLSGFADSEHEKRRAEEIASKVNGVERVDNKISVK